MYDSAFPSVICNGTVISVFYIFQRMFKPHTSYEVKISYGLSPLIYMVDFTH